MWVYIGNTLHIRSILYSNNNTFLQGRKQSKLMIDPIILSSITLQVRLLSRIKKGNLASQGLGFMTRSLYVEMKKFGQNALNKAYTRSYLLLGSFIVCNS
jgi:hypothetical protein